MTGWQKAGGFVEHAAKIPPLMKSSQILCDENLYVYLYEEPIRRLPSGLFRLAVPAPPTNRRRLPTYPIAHLVNYQQDRRGVAFA
jgi:hypothetical protein